MFNRKCKTCIAILLLLTAGECFSQEKSVIDFTKITKTEILKMNYDQLLELPLIDLKKMAEIAGITTDELLQLSLDQEVSTASKKGESLFESPLSASVVSKEEIVLSGVTTVEEAFRLVQGMIIRQESNGNFDIHIRGNDNVPPGNMTHFSENTISLVMIDNRIVYNYINGGVMWETLPISLSDIGSIEIVRGPSSSMYGPNAVSGVINIITRKPIENGIKVYGDVQAGNFSTKTGHVSILGKMNQKFQWKASGNFDYRERMATNYYEFLRKRYLPVDSIISMFGNQFAAKSVDPEISKDASSGNFGLCYAPNEEVNFQVNAGVQRSRAQTVFLENLATPLSIRKSETGYVDVKAQIFKLQAQINYLTGDQNLHELMLKPVVHYDLSFLTGNIEYDLNLNSLGIGEFSLRPGINFQQAVYDDSKHINHYRLEYSRPDIDGLLKGKKELNTFSGNIRLDYKPTSALRLITSFRADKFNYPDKFYYSYQTAASYRFRSNHLFRVVASKANRSAFMGDTYSDYKNYLEIHPLYGIPVYQVYAGFNQEGNNHDYTLGKQTMIEFGYRGMLSKFIQIDMEFFSTITSDFSAMMPSYVVLPQQSGNPEILDVWDYMNIEAKSVQKGISGSLVMNPFEKLFIKIFGTIQETEIKNLPFNLRTDSTNSIIAKNTPTFYGGSTINYCFLDRWNINMSVYVYSGQTHSRYRFDAINRSHTTMSTEIDANAILNMKVSYRVSQNNTLYLNIRNLANSNNPEFGYADQVKALCLIGMNFNF